MSKVLYVTSFNKQLFDLTGKKMVESFLETDIEGDLLVTYEENIGSSIPESDKVKLYNLDDSEFLSSWLEKNKDIIPKDFGGDFSGCNCASLNPSKHHLKNHIRRCPGVGFNRRACFWFRKIVAMQQALQIAEKEDYNRIIFIDSDVVFKERLTSNALDIVFKNAGYFFHLGPHRRQMNTGIESGFIGFSKDNRGFEFLNLVINSFKSGDFRKYDRWDDGFVFRMIWEENPQFPHRDVVKPHQLIRYGHVVRFGFFSKYLEHEKGSHTRKHNVLKGKL
jgi:hypothetical protein|tara:strand:- start:178 stop:1011 length:834 start_codon:yes stop_codon:yes gene_type:complete